MDLLVIGVNSETLDQAVLHTWADNSSWSGQWDIVGAGSLGLVPLRADIPNSLGAVSWGTGRIDVFWAQYNSALSQYTLKHVWFDNSQWSQPEDLGGPLGGLTFAAAVASPGSGLLKVYATGSDGHLWSTSFANGRWDVFWADVGSGCCLAVDASIVNSVAATSPPATGTVDVFIINTPHDLYSRAYTALGAAGWTYIDHLFDHTNIAATAWVPIVPSPPGGGGGGGGDGGGGGGGGGGPPCGPGTGRPCPLPK
jgi:hypothetical protein